MIHIRVVTNCGHVSYYMKNNKLLLHSRRRHWNVCWSFLDAPKIMTYSLWLFFLVLHSIQYTIIAVGLFHFIIFYFCFLCLLVYLFSFFLFFFPFCICFDISHMKGTEVLYSSKYKKYIINYSLSDQYQEMWTEDYGWG